MNTLSAQTEQVVTTVGTFYQWADTPTTVALVFGLAGAVFLGIYFIRRIRSKDATKKN
jgi:O-antigen/teichoic acid export membrane protein